MNECIYCGGHDCPECDITTPERSVEEIVEELDFCLTAYKELEGHEAIHYKNRLLNIVSNGITQTLQTERQKREEVVEKWNELYGNAKHSPEMVLHEFNVFIQTNNNK